MAGRCVFCREDTYEILDCHRLTPGSKYVHGAVVCLCAACHRRVHAGLIQIHGRHLRTDGRHVLSCTINGEKHWLTIPSVIDQDQIPLPRHHEDQAVAPGNVPGQIPSPLPGDVMESPLNSTGKETKRT